jgi:hypothetical protein
MVEQVIWDTNERSTKMSGSPSLHQIELPDWCYCPVTDEIMSDPVIVDASCKHTVDRSTFREWIARDNAVCPICSTSLNSLHVSPNVPLRDAIEYQILAAERQKLAQQWIT